MDTEVIDKLNDKTQEADIFVICQKFHLSNSKNKEYVKEYIKT